MLIFLLPSVSAVAIDPRLDYQPLFGKMSPHSSPRNSGWTRLISIVGFSQSGCRLQIFVWQHYRKNYHMSSEWKR